jgi:hypothetical protein
MPQAVHLELEVPGDLAAFHLPAGVQRRLTHLLDRQDQGDTLSTEERSEAEGLVDLADLLALLKLRAERSNGQS